MQVHTILCDQEWLQLLHTYSRGSAADQLCANCCGRQPAALTLQLPQMSGLPLAEVAGFSGCLRHLELSYAASSSLPGLTSLTGLACLSLRGCIALQEVALQPVLQGLTQASRVHGEES